MKNGEIIIIEDDLDDVDVISHLLSNFLKKKSFTNKVVVLSDAEKAYRYLADNENKPFLIISDINMPRMDGFMLRDKANNLKMFKENFIPYVFLTTGIASKRQLMEAYDLDVQGVFIKPIDYIKFEILIAEIVTYWKANTNDIA